MKVAHLRTLVAISDHRSFAVAAERLFLTPAAVSQQMRSLEEDLRTAIFDRSTRPPRLTAHGVFLAERARDVLHGFDAFVEAAHDPDEVSGRLALGCVAGVSTVLIPRALADLRRLYPRLVVGIEEGTTATLLHRVRRRELDAAIVTEPPEPEPELQMLAITDEPLLVVAPAGSAHGDWAAVLSGHPFLRINRESGVGSLIDTTLRRAGLVVDDAMELDSTETVVGLVRAGLGAGVVPAGRMQADAGGGIRILPFGEPPVSRRIVLAERRNNQRSDLSQILYGALKRLTETADAVTPGRAPGISAGSDIP